MHPSCAFPSAPCGESDPGFRLSLHSEGRGARTKGKAADASPACLLFWEIPKRECSAGSGRKPGLRGMGSPQTVLCDTCSALVGSCPAFGCHVQSVQRVPFQGDHSSAFYTSTVPGAVPKLTHAVEGCLGRCRHASRETGDFWDCVGSFPLGLWATPGSA